MSIRRVAAGILVVLLVAAPSASAAAASASPAVVDPGERVLLQYRGDALPVLGGLVSEGEVSCVIVAPDGSSTSPCGRSGSALTLRLATGSPPEASVTIVAPEAPGTYRVLFDVASVLPPIGGAHAAETSFRVLAPETDDGVLPSGPATGGSSAPTSANGGLVAPPVPGLPSSLILGLAGLALLVLVILAIAWAVGRRKKTAREAPRAASAPAAVTPYARGPIVFGPVRASAPAAPLLMRGKETLEEGDAERALLIFDAAADLEPRSPLARLGRSLALERLGRHEEARSEIARAAATAPAEPSVFYHQARQLVAGGRAKEAVAKLRIALNLDPALAEGARRDRDFAALANDEGFLGIVRSDADSAP